MNGIGDFFDLLAHEVSKVSLFRREFRFLQNERLTRSERQICAENLHSFPRQSGKFAVLEYIGAPPLCRKRRNIACDKPLSLPHSYDQRACPARTDDLLFPLGEHGKCKGADKLPRRKMHRSQQVALFFKIMSNHMRCDFAVRFGDKQLTARLTRRAQPCRIFDDAVVHDSDLSVAMRVGISLARRAVGRPARMPDPDRPGKL